MRHFTAVVLAMAVFGTIASSVPCRAEDERIPSDTLWRFQARYLHADHGLATAWNTFTGSPDVRVAVLDGAFEPYHSDFDQ